MFLILKEAFRDILQTGSVAGSSAFLANKMVAVIDFTQPVQLAELGAGTGCITRFILNQMVNPQSGLIAFELNPVFVNELNKVKDCRFSLVQDNALRITSYIKPASLDFIVSGLPLANMPRPAKNKLFADCNTLLKPDGYFIQFQYSWADLRLIRNNFRKVSVRFTLLNLPPAIIYYAKT